jgi:hypothetical protein
VTKYFASDRHCVEVQIEGARTGLTRTLRADKNGFYEASSKADEKALKESGFVQASLSGVTVAGVGYPCINCGHQSWFRKCGKCGAVTDG